MTLTEKLLHNPGPIIALLEELDTQAKIIDPWVLGLPLHRPAYKVRLVSIVRTWLAKLEDPTREQEP